MKKLISLVSSLLFMLLLIGSTFSACTASPYDKLASYLTSHGTYSYAYQSYSDVYYYKEYTCYIFYYTNDETFTITLADDKFLISLQNISEKNTTPDFVAGYENTNEEYVATGYIHRAVFSDEDPYLYDFYTNAGTYLESTIKKLIVAGLDAALILAECMLQSYDIGITIADLGFIQYA